MAQCSPLSAGNKASTPVHLRSSAAAPALRTTDQVFTLVVQIFWVRILASSLVTSLPLRHKKRPAWRLSASVRRLLIAPGRAAAGTSVVAIGTVTVALDSGATINFHPNFSHLLSDYESNSVRKNRTWCSSVSGRYVNTGTLKAAVFNGHKWHYI